MGGVAAESNNSDTENSLEIFEKHCVGVHKSSAGKGDIDCDKHCDDEIAELELDLNSVQEKENRSQGFSRRCANIPMRSQSFRYKRFF